MVVLQRLNYLKETSPQGESKEGDNDDMAFARMGGPGEAKPADGDTQDNSKTMSAEALQKEEDEFAKLEAQFIAELELRSEDLPEYAKLMGTDINPPEESNSKMR